MHSKTDFDIIILVGYFRSAHQSLSIISSLAKTLRIGLVMADLSDDLSAKIDKTQNQFRELCLDFGAASVSLSEIVSCRLLVVQQFVYPDELVARVSKRIIADDKIAMMSLASMGLEKHDRFLSQFDLREGVVPDKGLAEFLIAKRGQSKTYTGLTMYEVGLPYDQHPIFPSFSADWLIAVPTLFSFKCERDKGQFLRHILQLLVQIPKTDSVVYKPHNSNTLDYLRPNFDSLLARAVSWIPGVDKVITMISAVMPLRLKTLFERVETAVLLRMVERRVVSIKQVTRYGDQPLELFLPGVSKGVIGGYSNTIWGAAFFGLPYYNCAPEMHPTVQSELTSKSSELLLELNLQYFGVAPCNGRLVKNEPVQEIGPPLYNRSTIVDFLNQRVAEFGLQNAR